MKYSEKIDPGSSINYKIEIEFHNTKTQPIKINLDFLNKEFRKTAKRIKNEAYIIIKK